MSSDFVSLFTGMSERDIGYLLKNIVQRSINTELTNSELSSVDNKTPVLLTNSKDVELMNDIGIQSVINIETPTQYIMPEEPDGKDLKIWLKFQNAGELRDWSYQKNKSYSVGANTMPGLFYRTENNNMLKTELYSYFNGASHYGYVTDAIPVRITPNITANKITSFFMRLMPISLAKLLYAENNSLFTKVDDDQLRYGYSVTVDIKGSLHFYVKNNYRQYHLFLRNAYATLASNPIFPPGTVLDQYRFDNFNTTNFGTNYETLCNLVDQEPPFDDWFFKYNPTNHNMSVIKTTENNNAVVFADTSLVTVNPYLSVPIQEGKYTHSGTVQTTVYDNSGNNNNGTITNIATGGTWNDDNSLTNLGGNTAGNGNNALQIDFGAITALNTLTEFTIAFWINPLDNVINPNNYYERIVTKAGQGPSEIWIERRSSLNELEFNISNGSGVYTMVRFPNAFPNPNQWYFVVCKWKTGENLKISVNGTQIQSSNTLTTTISNSANNLRIFEANKSPKCKLALFKFYTTQISSTVENDLYYQGYHNPLFPKSENIQPVQEEEPDPIFVPFSNVYTLDKMATPVAGDYVKINSLAGDNPLIELYSVADGTSVSNPEVLEYDVDDGITTGGNQIPFTRIGSAPATLDSSDNSKGELGAGKNSMVALQISGTGSGLGQTINGKVITKAIFWMRRPTSSVTGTLYCRIWNANADATAVATLGSMPAANVNAGSTGSDWVAYTFENTANTVAMASGYRIGIEYQGYGGDDIVDVQRKANGTTSSPYDTVVQASINVGSTSWSTNTDYDIKCDLYTGGTGSATVDPFINMQYQASSPYDRVVQRFGTGDPLLGKIPTKVKIKLKRTGTATGTINVYLVTAYNGTIKAEFGSGISANSISTTATEYTFTNLFNTEPIVNGYVIMVKWTGMSSGSTTIGVLSNNGVTDPHPPTGTNTNSYISRYGGFSLTNYTSLDMSGKIYSGGNDFTAYVRLSETRTRVATKAVNNQSSLHNDKITKVVARIKKVGTPGGIITARIRDPNDVQRVLFSSVDADTIPANGQYNDVEFTNFIHTYRMNFATGSGDKVVYEFSGSSTSNYLEFNTNKDVFDNTNLATITQIYDNGNYVDDAQRDLAGKMYTGGEPDLTSRTRVAQSIEHQDSRLKGKKITRVQVWLRRTTTNTSGTVTCCIRRGSDDSLVKALGTHPVSSLTTSISSPSVVTFEDTTNNYPMTVGDKVTIEFSGGNSTDAVNVLVRTVTPNYDGENSFIRKYDEVDYDDEEITKDLCAIMDEGGFFFTPDPNAIPDPTPVNDKDLIICAGNNKLSGFFECFLMEFRMYTKDITLDNADNLYSNRYTISPIGPGQILMPFSLKCNTLDPV